MGIAAVAVMFMFAEWSECYGGEAPRTLMSQQ